MKIRNTSSEPQHFVGIGTFVPGEIKDLPREEAEILLRSPFIELVQAKVKGTSKDRSVKGIEQD